MFRTPSITSRPCLRIAPLLLLLAGCASHSECEVQARELAARQASDAKEMEHLKSSVAGLEERLRDLTTSEAVARTRADEHAGAVKALQERLDALETLPKKETPRTGPPPMFTPVRGVVLAANSEMDIYLLSRGEEAGVKVGDEFTVFRGDQFVAVVVVDKVYVDKASCFVKKVKDKPLQKSSIKTGDKFASDY